MLNQHFVIAEAIIARNPEAADAAATAHINRIAKTLTEMRKDQVRAPRRPELLARHAE